MYMFSCPITIYRVYFIIITERYLIDKILIYLIYYSFLPDYLSCFPNLRKKASFFMQSFLFLIDIDSLT